MTTELVAFARGTCPTCTGSLTRYSWGQPAMQDGTEHRVSVRSDSRGEFALPLGRYSMAPTVRAERLA